MSRSPAFRCGCGEDKDYAELIVCKGVFEGPHTRPWAWHAECQGVGDEVGPSWLCDECELHQASQENSQSQHDSQASSAQLYDVRQVLNEWYDPQAQAQKFLLRWKPDGQRKYPPSWVAEEDCGDITHLIQMFRDNETLSDLSDDGSDYAAESPDQALQADEATGNRYYQAFKRGYWSLIRETTKEFFAHSTAQGMPKEVYPAIAIEILSATYWKILSAVCGAGLQRRKAGDPELDAILTQLMHDSVKHPGIYMIELTDNDGLPPTVKEMRLFIERARLYRNLNDPRSADFAIKVESVSIQGPLDSTERADIRAGLRKYLPTSGARNSLETLLTRLEAEINTSGLNDDDRMPFSLREVGYSDNSKHRIEEQHLKHQSSNMQMTLFEAISRADSTLNGDYRLHGHVIFLCLSADHAKPAEMLFSCLAQAYVQTGRGFNGAAAGGSNASSKRYSPEEWEQWQQEAVQDGLVRDTMEAEKARVQKFRTAQQSLELDLEESKMEQTEFTKGLLVLSRQKRELFDSMEAELGRPQIS